MIDLVGSLQRAEHTKTVLRETLNKVKCRIQHFHYPAYKNTAETNIFSLSFQHTKHSLLTTILGSLLKQKIVLQDRLA